MGPCSFGREERGGYDRETGLAAAQMGQRLAAARAAAERLVSWEGDDSGGWVGASCGEMRRGGGGDRVISEGKMAGRLGGERRSQAAIRPRERAG